MAEHSGKAITPSRLELIRATVELNPAGSPAYQDRADLIAHVDWLNGLLVQAERAMADKGLQAARSHGMAIEKSYAVVLYFADVAEQEAFVRVVQEAHPNLVARTVK